MQTTQEIADILNIPAPSVRRIKKQLDLTEGFHFVKEGSRLLWTPDGADAITLYVNENPFVGLLGGDLFGDEEEIDAA
jgi:hypothetical protein